MSNKKKARSYTITIKVKLLEVTKEPTHLKGYIEDAMIGEFAQRMWKLGTYWDAEVTKIKED